MLLLSAIAGFDAKDPTSLAAPVPDYLATAARGVRGLTIGIDPDYNEAGLDAGVVQALRAARRTFEETGAIVREVQLPDSTAVAAAWATLAGSRRASSTPRPTLPKPLSTVPRRAERLRD